MSDTKLHPVLKAIGFSGHRQWVYPMAIKGTFTHIHKFTSAALFAFLILVPWMSWDGARLLRFDLPGRQAVIAGQIFTPTDGVLIMLGALTAAFAMFFFTSMLGRLWCGYGCPQSVFMINFVYPIEEFIQGSRSKRRQRDKHLYQWDNAWRKGLTWTIYVGLAGLISMAFMGFFTDPATLWTGGARPGEYTTVAFFTGLWSLDFIWYREQVCNFICPYARFQGALTDQDSLVITYDAPRGEPRGKAARATGGCIDCKKCVVVCPQGIDIRDGFQLECIACGRCIDACETVMPKLGYPNLIKYSTEDGSKMRWVRPRTVIYAGLMGVLLSAMAHFTMQREDVEVLVDRMPGAMYIQDADGMVRNTYMVQLADRNADDGKRVYAVGVDGLPEGSEVRVKPVQLARGEHASVPVIVRIPREHADRTVPLTLHIRGADGLDVPYPTTFKGPGADTSAHGLGE